MQTEDTTSLDLTSVFNEKYVFGLMKCYVFSMNGMIDKKTQ